MTETGKKILADHEFMGSPGWLDILRKASAMPNTPPSYAKLVSSTGLEIHIDKNSRAARKEGIDDAIAMLQRRMEFYQQQLKQEDDARYWEGCIHTTRYLIGLLQDLRDRRDWTPGTTPPVIGADAEQIVTDRPLDSPFAIRVPN